MQRSAFVTAALLTTASAFSTACNDLGSCDDPARGRSTVVSGSQLMFTGQAVINSSCLPCHSHTATGSARKGAPAGLNFDLYPLSGTTTVNGASGGVAGVALDPKELAGLRTRQRRVYDLREMIWDQIDKGLMPPSKTSYRSLMSVFKAAFGTDMTCTRGTALTSLDDGVDREAFRNWLACDVPIVEATSDQLPYKALPAGSTPADSAAGAAYYSIPGVSVGYQYPSCGGMSSALDFTKIYNDVLSKPSYTCLACHGGTAPMGAFDIGTIDKAYTTLLGSGAGGKTTCAMSPTYVKPNDPANSYLLNMLVMAKTRCTPNLMPLGGMMDAADVDLITRWIMAGAPRAATSGGADAGAP
jgi:hypothetical protein